MINKPTGQLPRKGTGSEKKENHSLHEFLRLPRLLGAVSLPLSVACLVCANLAAAPSSVNAPIGDILANLGDAGLNGQPGLSFDFVRHPGADEIKRLGFAFKLRHQVVLAHGRKAVSDWQIPALRTAVCLSEEGDLTWLRPDGRTVRFKKTGAGFSSGNEGSTARVSPDGGEIVISTVQSAKWFYKNGFVESLHAMNQEYYFKTDRESILVIGKKDAGGALLEVRYSDTGLLEELVFTDGKKCSFQWTPDNCLRGVDGNAGTQVEFEYDNRLLKNWRLGGGALRELKWIPVGLTRRMAFGKPPVLLGGDSLYDYRWSRRGSVDILDVSRRSGVFVSRTRFSAAGIEQKTPYETLRHAYGKP